MIKDFVCDNNDFLEIIEDKRFLQAFNYFNECEWYKAHDLFEEIWHETHGPVSHILQAIIQISVAQLHLSNGNKNGAIMLYGEGLGRLRRIGRPSIGLDIESLCLCVESRLSSLQNGQDPSTHKPPVLLFKS